MKYIVTPARARRFALKALPAALLGLGAPLVQAAGFQLLEQNASGLGQAYAGSAAVADDASTIFFNPAGMTELKDREYSLGGNLVALSARFRNQGSSTGLLTGDGGDPGSPAVVPNAYLSWKLTPELWAGVGVGAPFGLKTEYDNPWTGGAQALKFGVKTLNLNPSLAWKLNEQVSLGAGLNWQKLQADYVRLVAVGPANGLPLNTATVRFKADGTAWGWNVGALVKLSPDTRVGVSYRSKVRHTAEGSLRTVGGGAPLAAVADSGAKADITLPDMAFLSIAHRLDERWLLLGDASWTGWSSIQKADIVRTTPTLAGPGAGGPPAQTLDTNFRDTWRLALGANYVLNPAWTLKFGTAFDRSPVPDAESRLVSLPDNNRTWLSVGAQWRPTKEGRVDFGLARIFVKDAAINNNQVAAGRGLVAGSYTSKVWVAGVQYSHPF